MSEYILKVENIRRKYGEIEALKEVSFCLDSGQLTVILGENGAGKTTLFKIITKFLRQDSGRVEIRAKNIGYVPEHPVFFYWLRGDEIIHCTARLFGIPESKVNKLIEFYCEKLSFEPALLRRKPQTYSLGNQKKFSYLQNLVLEPDFLIIDEPLNAVDPVTIKKLRDLFLELKSQGKTILISSHIISEAEKVCDNFIIIKKGRIILQEKLQRFKEKYFFSRICGRMIDEKTLQAFSQLIKKEDLLDNDTMKFTLLVGKEQEPCFRQFLLEKGVISEESEPDLENIFLFFA